MKSTKMLTQEELKQQLSYDPNTGSFFWIKPKPGVTIGKKAGTIKKDGRCRIKINNKFYYAHRLAWLYVYGSFPKDQIDHINRNPLDNRINNLRDVEQGTNIRNSYRSHAPSHGIYPHGKGWRVQFKINKIICGYGTYSKIEQAKLIAQKTKDKLALWKIPEEIKNDNVKL